MIDGTTGYVRLQDFAETTDRDLGAALDDAVGQGHAAAAARPARQPRRAARPGDPRVEPVPAAGRHDRLHARPRAELRRGLPRDASEPTYTDLPVVVLVNRNSASAVGDRVAARCRITTARSSSARRRSARRSCSRSTGSAEGAGLALTTARYYTPSGRLIQRPWDGTFDEYLTYSLRDQDAAAPARRVGPRELHRRRPQGVQRRRHRARPARWPGPVEGSTRRGSAGCSTRGRCSRPSPQRFSAEGDTRIRRRGQGPAVRRARTSTVDDAMVADVPGVPRRRSGSRSTRRRSRRTPTFIRAMIRYEIDLDLFGVEDARAHLLASDPQAQFALAQFGEAERG